MTHSLRTPNYFHAQCAVVGVKQLWSWSLYHLVFLKRQVHELWCPLQHRVGFFRQKNMAGGGGEWDLSTNRLVMHEISEWDSWLNLHLYSWLYVYIVTFIYTYNLQSFISLAFLYYFCIFILCHLWFRHLLGTAAKRDYRAGMQINPLIAARCKSMVIGLTAIVSTSTLFPQLKEYIGATSFGCGYKDRKYSFGRHYRSSCSYHRWSLPVFVDVWERQLINILLILHFFLWHETRFEGLWYVCRAGQCIILINWNNKSCSWWVKMD